MAERVDISVVVPLYNEAESLPELVEWIDRVAVENALSYEIVMIDDGSSDDSWGGNRRFEIALCGRACDRLRAQLRQVGRSLLRLRGCARRSGLYDGCRLAGFARRDTTDAAHEYSTRGYDLVSGWKRKRHDPAGKRWPSKFFNLTARIVSGIKLHDFNCGLKAYRRKVVKAIEVYGEMHRYIPILAKNAGFRRIGEKVVEHRERKYGVSKFGLERMLKGYLDLITVTFMSRFGRSPMYFFGGLGTLMFLLGGATTVWVVAEKIYSQSHGLPWRGVTEQPLFYLALAAVVLGVQLFLAGFLGELINRNSPERNKYLIDKRID